MATARGTDRIDGTGSDSLDLRLASGLLWLLALLQALSFAGDVSSGHAVLSAGVALASTLVLWRVQTPGRRLVAQVLLSALAVANLVSCLMLLQGDHRYPVLLRGVSYGYVALALAGLAALVWRSAATGLLLAATLMACGLMALDTYVSVAMVHVFHKPVVSWIGGTVRHPVLEEYYPPRGSAVTRYVDNPRGYFKTMDARAERWQLSTTGNSRAGLVFPGSPTNDRVRVTVEQLAGQAPWQVQLAFSGIQVRQGEPLLLALRLKADQPRSLGLGLSQNHAPWRELGLYRSVEAGPEWRDIVIPLTARETEDQARLIFDLGESTTAVEIESVVLRRRSTSDSVVKELPASYAVDYRFNDRGCRGESVAGPAPPGTRRVLLLGDSFTLGVGVHEADTVGPQLQALLNAGPGGVRYQVLNCGVSGYATRQERLMYELQAPHYRPDIVILSMVENDDASWVQDVANGHFWVPGKLDRLFPMAGGLHLAARLRDKPSPDFAESVVQLRELLALCQRDGARLAVVSFRNQPLDAGHWGVLARNVSAGLKGTEAAWLDLGDEMLRQHDSTRLQVYPGADLHPNEVAHRSAAQQLAALLRQRAWAD